jgi:NAD(P)-dependent dehydrogenase (short-subunit alcohol dehydrogenase family)
MSAEEKQMAGWASDGIPDQSGKTVLVTGGNSGLGYETVLQLARKGARVLLAARDRARGTAALERLGAGAPGRQAELAQIDLADLTSVERFAAGFLAGGEGLDLLINNAGVMAIPQRETTTQGYERQFGTNHLGHFALTGRLLPALARRPGSRVVTVSSNRHKSAKGIDFDDLQAEHGYRPWGAYDQSKLANAMFVLELDRRLRAAGLDIISAGAHPGFAHTNLQLTGPRSGGTSLAARGMGLATRLFAQPAADGALPTLYAATAPDVHRGDYFGPDGPGEMRGHHPKLVQFSAAAHDQAAGARLWAVSEELTGVTFEALTAK